MSAPPDAPRVEIWLDTNGDGSDALHYRVKDGEQVVDRADVDVDTVLRTEQYLSAFERPALTLLTLWEDRVTDEPVAEQPAEELPAEVE